MIPKKIHYCWFGNNDMSPMFERCLASWRKFLPDYEIVRWDEANLPKDALLSWKYIRDKKYAFASDYARYHILYEYGGIYLDTDVEVLKSFDPLLDDDFFIGYEDTNRIACGVIGGVKGNNFSKDCMFIMDDVEENKKAFLIAPEVAMKAFKKNDNIKVYPEDFFYPYNPYAEKNEVKQLMFSDITENTFAIHHWEKKWKISLFSKIKRMIS